MFILALVVLVTMAAAGSRAVTGSRAAAWTMLSAAALWPLINRPIEGPVLLIVGKGHGLTVSDLLTPIAAALSIIVLTGLFGRIASRRAAGVS